MDEDLEDDGAIALESGERVAELKCSVGMFLDRTTILYGPSFSGKTVITKHIMGTLRGLVDQIIVVSPSESQNHAYKGCVPQQLIHHRLYLPNPADPKKEDGIKGAIRFLDALWARQEMMSSIAGRANNPEALMHLFRRLPREARGRGVAVIEKLNEKRQRVVDRVRASHADDAGNRDEKVKEVNEKFKTMLALLYKKYIIPHRDALWAAEGLSEDERYCLAYIQFNPRLLVVFDDCAAELKALFPKEIFRKLFYRGRHVKISSIFCVQDDTDLPANLRKNAFVSVFTKGNVALANFTRASNQFGRQVRDMVTELVPRLFVGHRKLAYIREDPTGQHYYWLQVPMPRPFRFGSDALWELTEGVAGDETSIDHENPFYRRFQL